MAITKLCQRCYGPMPCATHAQEGKKAYDKWRGSAHRRGYTRQWANYSKEFIRTADCECGRNHALCEQCQREGRVRPSVLTDHITPVHGANDPLFWAHDDHQGLCRPCHDSKTADDKAQGLTVGNAIYARVQVVVGPPGVGKTTYVREHMQRGDLVLDMDALFSALSGLKLHDKPDHLLPFVAAARDAVYERLSRPVGVPCSAWLITTEPTHADVLCARLRGKRIDLGCSEEERQQRITQREVEIGFA